MSSFNFNVNYNPGITPPVSTEGPSSTAPSSGPGATPNLTVSVTRGGVDGSTPVHIDLEIPMLDAGDFDPTELVEQLRGLNFSQEAVAQVTKAFFGMLNAVLELQGSIQGMTLPEFHASSSDLAKAFEAIEKRAQSASTGFFEMINSAKYPSFNDFLKLMMQTAQVLRSLASEARQASIQGQYETTLLQVDEMKQAAQHNYDAAMKEVKAQRAEAIASLVVSALTIAMTVVAFRAGNANGLGGAGKSVSEGADKATMLQRWTKPFNSEAMRAWMNTANSVSQATSGIATASASLFSADQKADAAQSRFNAEICNALVKSLEAGLKLQQSAEQNANELMDIAKSLRDMILKLHQDMLSAQSQVIQRANI